MKSFSALFLISSMAALAVMGVRASAQATVNENQTTYLYVDAKAGSDSNAGGISSPLKTVQAGVNKANLLNQKGTGVRLIINPGVYREAVNVGSYNSTSAAFTVQAAVTGTAIIAGSDVLTGWSQASGVYTRTWPYAFNACTVPAGWPTTFAPNALLTDMIYVNGVPMTQVLTYADLRPGTFYVNYQYSILHVDPPLGTNMSTALVEAAARQSTFSVIGRSNVVLRGLVFEHAANCINTTGAFVSSSNNVLVDSVQALWNNWGGLGVFSSTNVTVQNSVGSYNGGIGFQANQSQKVLFSFNETDYNNWRGAQSGLYNWGMGGTKMMYMRTATVQNHFSYNNLAQGLWFDTDNKNITINNATLSGNEESSLQIERDEGPITLENSVLCSSGAGITVLTSPALTIQNNTFYNNSGTNKYQAEIFLAGTPGGQVITDWQTGQSYDLFTTGTTLSGNTFEDATSGQLVFGTYLSGSDWTSFASTLKASSNTWYDPTTATSFKIPNGKLVNMAGWQSAVQTDYSSVWKLPATSPVIACAAPTTSYPDFSIVVDNNNYTMTAGSGVATIHLNSYSFGAVALSTEGLPAGVSATFSKNNVASGVITLTFAATSTAVNQTVPITIWGVNGSRVHGVTVYLHVVHA